MEAKTEGDRSNGPGKCEEGRGKGQTDSVDAEKWTHEKGEVRERPVAAHQQVGAPDGQVPAIASAGVDESSGGAFITRKQPFRKRLSKTA